MNTLGKITATLTGFSKLAIAGSVICGIKFHDGRNEKMRLMSIQAFFYVMSYLLSFGTLFLLKMISIYADFSTFQESSIFPLHVLASIFAPLQGVSTLIVYTRPTFLQNRITFPEETWWWCVRRLGSCSWWRHSRGSPNSSPMNNSLAPG